MRGFKITRYTVFKTGFVVLLLSMGTVLCAVSPNPLDQKISVQFQNHQASDVLRILKEKTGLNFSFKSKILREVPAYTASYNQVTIRVILNEWVQNTGLQWEFIAPKTVVIQEQTRNKPIHVFRGRVLDSLSGESLPHATLYIRETGGYAQTNQEGYFAIMLHAGTITLEVSYVGYNKQVVILQKEHSKYDIQLNPILYLAPATVESRKSEGLIKRHGKETRLQSWQINELSPMFGESDVFRTLQLLPGVQSVGEGAPGLYVRGGSQDQNLILLDGVQIYNPVHILGFYSIFNPAIVKGVSLKKGQFPAQYGGRLSSVIDITTISGNRNRLQGEASVGIIGSQLSVNGPINSKTTFVLSARRTHLDLLLSPFLDANLSTQNTGFLSAYYFYDLNGKVTHLINKKNRLIVSAYTGLDRIGINNTFELETDQKRLFESDKQRFSWGNHVGSARWESIIGKQAFLNTTAWITSYEFGNRIQYDYELEDATQDLNSFFDYRFDSRIRDVGIQSHVALNLRPNLQLNAGAFFIHRKFSPGISSLTGNLPDLGIQNPLREPYIGNELGAFIEKNYTFRKKGYWNVGLHYAAFITENKTYHKPQPRVSYTYELTKKWNITASYSHMVQFMHLLTNSTVGIPNDLWVLSSQDLKPQENHQYSFVSTYFLDAFSIKLEGFYKNLAHLLDYAEGTSFIRNHQNWEEKLVSGMGNAYGLEVTLEKSVGKFTGWIGYCLSKSTREFDEINEGEPFLFLFDRRHDLSSSVTYKMNERNTVSVNFVFASGNFITLPNELAAGMLEPGQFVDVFLPGSRNNFRLNHYHRMDVNYSRFGTNSVGRWVMSMGLYNAYNRLNPYYVVPGYNENGLRVVRQITLFPIIPSFTFRQEF